MGTDTLKKCIRCKNKADVYADNVYYCADCMFKIYTDKLPDKYGLKRKKPLPA